MKLRLASIPLIFVVLLAIVVLTGWLGSRGLNDPDEGRFAEIGREMALQSDWLVPHLNGVPHFQKPPLTYWITAVFIRLLGANEWAIRLVPALAAFGTLLLTMYIAGVLYGEGCRWKAGLLLLSSLGFFIVARLITTDMVLTFCITAAIAGFVAYVYHGQRAWLAVSYVAMGLGFLAKGPLGIVIPALAGVAMQMGQRRRRKPVVQLFWWIGLPVAMLIGFSWYLALIHRDKTLLDYFVRYEFIDRVATNTHNRAKPLWFYPETLALGLVPWTGFAIVMLQDAWSRRRIFSAADLWLFVGWLIVPYILLSLVVSKLATYLLPLTPPLAILIARWLEHPATGDRWRRPACFTVWSLGLLLPALPCLRLLSGNGALAFEDLPIVFVITIVLATASFFLLGSVLIKYLLSLRGFLFWAATTWAFVMLAFASQADRLITGSHVSVRSLAECIKSNDPRGTIPVLVFKARANSTEFYLRRLVYRGFSRSDVVLPLKDELRRRIVADEAETVRSFGETPAFVLITQSRYLKEPYLQGWHPVTNVSEWVLLANQGRGSCPAASSRNRICFQRF